MHQPSSIPRSVVAALGFAFVLAGNAGAERVPLDRSYGRIPLHFEPNRGQAPANIRFVTRGAGYGFFLTSSEAILVLKTAPAGTGTRGAEPRTPPATVRLRLLGGSEARDVVGLEELPGKSNYFRGADPRQWRTDVPHYARVRYRAVYPGIDLVYYGDQRQLEYDLVIAPGADARRIRLGIDGVNGLRLDGHGDLILRTPGGDLVQKAPVVYQETDAGRRRVAGGYVLRGRKEVGFRIGPYDRTLPLVIDPILVYSTYLGGGNSDEGASIAVDTSGNAYITGSTYSLDFPTASPFRASNAGDQDVFVTKLNPAGSALVYSTYLGGSGTDFGLGIAVDASGNAYVTGFTASSNFPIFNPDQPTFGGDNDAFVAKLNSTGSALVYSTYLGDTGYDTGEAIAVDGGGNAYVTGLLTRPTGFGEVLAAKVSTAGTVVGVTFGGASSDRGRGIAVDGSGNAYVTGETCSADFPTTVGAIQPTFGGGCILTGDAFVAKVDPVGATLLYSSYLGGSSDDAGYALRLGSDGTVYVTGETSSVDFPTVNPLMGTRQDSGSGDAFVTRLNAAMSAFVYSTYLGGNFIDGGRGIAVDTSGNAYVTGHTYSDDFPLADPFQNTLGVGGDADAFVTKLNAAGSAFLYSTYLGGSDLSTDFILGNDLGHGIAVDGSGNAYVTGSTNAQDFPTAVPFQGTKRGNYEAFVTKLGATSGPPAGPTVSIDDRAVAEGAAANAAFRIFLSEPSAQNVTVNYATAEGTAKAGTDYGTISGTLTFPPGRTNHSIFVGIVTDGVIEGTETFVVNLSNVSGGSLGDGQATGTIADPPAAAKVAMYRSYNRGTDYHFFTTDLASKDFAVNVLGFQDESNPIPFYVWNTRQTNSVPLFRMYNPNLGRHFYTAGTADRDFLMSIGMVYEKDEGFIYPLGPTPPSGTTELFKLYNNNSGTHLFTADAAQKDGILALFPGVWVQHTSVGYIFAVP